MTFKATVKRFTPVPIWALLQRIRAAFAAVERPRFVPAWVPRAVAKAASFGLKYRCPVCGARLRRFEPFGLSFPALKELEIVGGGRRENSQCSVCGCVDRNRLVFLYLKKKLGIQGKAVRLLHVAPEKTLAQYLSALERLEYITADLSGQDVMVKMDITDIQYPDNHFGGIICNHVLEHIPDDRRAMGELFRVLQPGGWAILQVPMSRLLPATLEDPSVTTDADRERVYGQCDHVRVYASDYVDRLSSAGFTVEIFQWWKDRMSFGGASNRYGLLKDECLFLARKRA